MHAKNMKLDSMDQMGSLSRAYDSWETQWSKATDPQFCNKDRTFVDLAKQVMLEDSALPYDEILEDHEVELYLWKRCCLDAYAKTRTAVNADGSPAKGNPKHYTYPLATMWDNVGHHGLNSFCHAAWEGKPRWSDILSILRSDQDSVRYVKSVCLRQ